MAKLPKGVTLTVKPTVQVARVLTPDALAFLANLHRAFNGRRQAVLTDRITRNEMFGHGALPEFSKETSAIRTGNWKVAPLPRDVEDQRVGIVMSADRKSILTALNSGARQCVADFDDLTSPTWDNIIDGQINLMDRWTSAMEHIDPATGKRMALARKPATLVVRPRGVHLDEPHLLVDGKPVAAFLFDAGLYLFHNARTAIAKGSGPYLCLPGIESRSEARLWNEVLIHAESFLGLPVGSIRTTLMIETISAVFEMDEIVYEMRDHVTALAYGASNLAFSWIRSFAARKSHVLPESNLLEPLHRTISEVLIKTAHARGCLALGTMAAEVPSRDDSESSQRSISSVRSKAEWAVRAGCDGMWVTHPAIVAAALAIFDNDLPTPNQLYVSRDDVVITSEALVAPPAGGRSEADFCDTIRISVLFIAAWLSGRGDEIIDGDRVGMAGVELRRSQLWQWLHHGAKLDTGQRVSTALFETVLFDVLKVIKSGKDNDAWRDGRYKEAATLLKALATAATLEPAITRLASRKLP